MSISDPDLELLESYLDDELAGAQLESLRKRLSSEPSLTVAMDELRGQREMRQMFFSTCEPDSAQVDQLIRSVNQQATRDIVWGQRNRKLRFMSGVAACLVVGFVFGRATHKSSDMAPVAGPSNMQIAGLPKPALPGTGTVPLRVTPNEQVVPDVAREVVFDGPRLEAPRDFNINRIDPTKIGPNMVGYQVKLIDANGNVVRQFNSPAEFNNFVNGQNSPSSQPATFRGN